MALDEDIKNLSIEIDEALKYIDVNSLNVEIGEHDKKMSSEGFWDDPDSAKTISSRLDSLRKRFDFWSNLKGRIDFLSELYGNESLQEADRSELADEYNALKVEYDRESLFLYLNGEYDSYDCIVEISAGMGGLDAEDWAAMLLRMYLKYFEDKGFVVSILLKNDSESGGLKKVILEVKGDYAYGYLKREKGAHRLVRLSPFKSSDSRQTSFAMFEVLPVIEKTELEIDEKDLKIDVFKASGHGGQGVNTTDSAVRITHVPTGIVVICQNERSQLKNKEQAMKVLSSRLFEKKMEEEAKKKKEIKGDFVSADWGNQIRSYVLHPYKMVKDHRTSVEVGDIESVLDGKLDPFIEAELKSKEF